MKTHTPNKILVLQQHTMGPRFFFIGIIEAMEMDVDDFNIQEHPDAIRPLIIQGEDQILILGSINDSVEDAGEFAREMLTINPELYIIGFSSSGVIPNCDIFVHKKPGSSSQELRETIRQCR